MANPFEKRATEYLRDDAAFLSVVTPEPLHTFFERPATEGKLYDRLCMIVGTPGSGKTTIATLLQFKTVRTLLGNPNHSEYRPLVNALRKCNVIEAGGERILGCRLPMESEYRDFWELPYTKEIKIGLLKSFLQSRAVLSWLRGMADSGIRTDAISIQLRDGGGAAKDSIGGLDYEGLFKRASEIERLIYEVGTALVPLSEHRLREIVSSSYNPLDVIEFFVVTKQSEPLYLKPLVMLDDVHILHPEQLSSLVTWLARREMKIGRWMLMRLDAQTPQSVLLEELNTESGIASESQIKRSREITHIWLQGNKASQRRADFRVMARSMADKYLRLMPVFHRQGLTSFQDLLISKATPISGANMQKLKDKVERLRIKLNISHDRIAEFTKDIDDYFTNSDNQDNGEDVRWAMLNIVLHRYANRVPQGSLFDNSDESEITLSKPIKISSGLAEGARISLLHEYKRPYYYGMNALCDGSSENAEQFLQLAGELVSASEARIIQGKQASLATQYQHKLLTDKATKIVREWAFPKSAEVRTLCHHMAKECLEKTLEPNASLDAGANAFGIPQHEYERIPSDHPELAKILQFGIAYNAFSIKQDYSAKNKKWALIELSGPILISSGLTMARGGFLERTVKDLWRPFEEKQ